MKPTALYECLICYFQGNIEDFTPKTATAEYVELECPNCLNSHLDDCIAEVTYEYELAA